MPESNTLRLYQSNNKTIERSRDATTGEGYFWSLCHPRPGKKQRTCLKCQRKFISDGPSHRKCAQCGEGRLVNPRLRKKA